MIHLITENNKDLENRTFPLGRKIRKHLQATLDNYDGDKTADGYKRLNNLLSMPSITYVEMKRIKNFFDNYRGTPKSTEYILNGGLPMKLWVNDTLNTATQAIDNYKKAMKDTGVKNAYIRPHEKDRQKKPKKSTHPTIQTKDVSDKMSDNSTIKFESRKRKVIIITEKQAAELFINK